MMTAVTRPGTSSIAQDLEAVRNAQMILTAAIQHAREESLDPNWHDQILGLRLRLEKMAVANIGLELDAIETSR
jgi:hypothetical protein